MEKLNISKNGQWALEKTEKRTEEKLEKIAKYSVHPVGDKNGVSSYHVFHNKGEEHDPVHIGTFHVDHNKEFEHHADAVSGGLKDEHQEAHSHDNVAAGVLKTHQKRMMAGHEAVNETPDSN